MQIAFNAYEFVLGFVFALSLAYYFLGFLIDYAEIDFFERAYFALLLASRCLILSAIKMAVSDDSTSSNWWILNTESVLILLIAVEVFLIAKYMFNKVTIQLKEILRRNPVSWYNRVYMGIFAVSIAALFVIF